jgi:hypothetical protein
MTETRYQRVARFTPSGTLDHSAKVNPAEPFVLSIPRNLIDGLGRPLRGVHTYYTYSSEQAALVDFRAAKAAKLRPLLRDFTNLDAVRLVAK